MSSTDLHLSHPESNSVASGHAVVLAASSLASKVIMLRGALRRRFLPGNACHVKATILAWIFDLTMWPLFKRGLRPSSTFPLRLTLPFSLRNSPALQAQRRVRECLNNQDPRCNIVGPGTSLSLVYVLNKLLGRRRNSNFQQPHSKTFVFLFSRFWAPNPKNTAPEAGDTNRGRLGC